MNCMRRLSRRLPARSVTVRSFARILTQLCALLSIAVLGARANPIEAPLVLTIAMREGPPGVHLALRNRSNAPVHVLLGSRSGRAEALDAISLLFVNAEGQRIPIVFFDYKFGGNTGVVDEVIAPGDEWKRDVNLSEYAVFKDPANPSEIDKLPAGSYAVYAVFKGESIDWPPHTPPYWLGTVRSAPVQYVISK